MRNWCSKIELNQPLFYVRHFTYVISEWALPYQTEQNCTRDSTKSGITLIRPETAVSEYFDLWSS